MGCWVKAGSKSKGEQCNSFSSCRDLASPTPACPTSLLTKWNKRALHSTEEFSESREGAQGKWNECNSWDAWNLNRVGFLLLSLLTGFQGKISRLLENVTDFQNKPIFYSLYMTEIERNKLFKKNNNHFLIKILQEQEKRTSQVICPTAIRLFGVLPSATLDPWENNNQTFRQRLALEASLLLHPGISTALCNGFSFPSGFHPLGWTIRKQHWPDFSQRIGRHQRSPSVLAEAPGAKRKPPSGWLFRLGWSEQIFTGEDPGQGSSALLGATHPLPSLLQPDPEKPPPHSVWTWTHLKNGYLQCFHPDWQENRSTECFLNAFCG